MMLQSPSRAPPAAAAVVQGASNPVLQLPPLAAQPPPRRTATPPEPLPRPREVPDIRGKHRKQAELNRLTLEVKYLEEELENLGRTDLASKACEEFVACIERTPDPLLPVTVGSERREWNRWFERPPQTRSCCWFF